MFVNGEKIIKVLESIAPSNLAEHWDNCGLILGSSSREINKILVALEINEAVVNEAVSKSVDLIVTHHPLIFKAMKKINDHDPIGKLVLKLVKQGISVYSLHTNLDVAQGGTNDFLANRFNLKNIRPLMSTKSEVNYKLVVYVPETHTEMLRKALAEQGAGRLGNYSDCAFISKGTGLFKPTAEARPFLGNAGALEQVSEDKLEVIVPQWRLKAVTAALQQVHPYEVPAYDVIRLENEMAPMGLGRIGELDVPTPIREFLLEVRSILALDEIRFNGKEDAVIKRVALCSGAGSDFIEQAHRMGADLYLTGDLKHHEYRDAELLGLNLADIGHFESENIYMVTLKSRLEQEFEQKNYDVRVVMAETLKPSYWSI